MEEALPRTLAVCGGCGLAEVGLSHALVSCPASRAVYAELGERLAMDKDEESFVRQLFRQDVPPEAMWAAMQYS